MHDNERLLREYVRCVLREDDGGGGGDYGGGYSGDSGGGLMGTWGYMDYGPSLTKAFIDPFLDVGKVLKATGTQLATRVKTLAKVVLETTLTTLVPMLESNYKLIFDQEKRELDKIKSKYAQLFSKIDAAFTKDVMFVSFMLDPSSFLTAKVVEHSPEMVMNVLEIFATGSENIAAYLKDIRGRLKKIDKDLRDDVENYKLDTGGRYVSKNARGPYMTAKKREFLKQAGLTAGYTRSGTSVNEDAGQLTPQQQKAQLLMSVVNDRNLKNLISQTELARQMNGDVRGMVSRITGALTKEAASVLQVSSLKQLQTQVKKPLGLEKLESADPHDAAQVESSLLAQVKAAMKNFYVKALTDNVNSLQASGLDPNNLYIRSLKGTISRVTSM